MRRRSIVSYINQKRENLKLPGATDDDDDDDGK
jgi:hypothetical protein